MSGSKFFYVTYIRTTPEKLWEALLQPEFTRQHWFGCTLESDWKAGSPWKLRKPDGEVADAGTVLEIDPPKKLVLRWRNQFRPELHAEGDTQCTFDLEQTGDMVKLTVSHSIGLPNAKVIEAVSGGWPKILSSLKSLLETGRALDRP